MSVRKILALVLVLILLGIGTLVFVASRKPDQYQIVRTIQIDAAPTQVFHWVGQLSEWEAWSPWKYRDASIVNRYEGPSSGIGAKQHWTSEKSGTGDLEFIGYEENVSIRYRLTFIDWDSTSEGSIQLKELRSGVTEVSWSMEGHNTLSNKVLWTVFGMEKALAADFDLGLSLLKNKCEGKPQVGG